MDINGPFLTTESWGCVEARNPYKNLVGGSKAATPTATLLDVVPLQKPVPLQSLQSDDDKMEEGLSEDSSDTGSTSQASPRIHLLDNAEFGIGILPHHQES